MKKLSNDWFTDGRIDFELKKYTLLAYLQEVNNNFHLNKLYPQLADLVFHYNNLWLFKESKEKLQKSFPWRLTNADLEQLRLNYESMVTDDSLMNELENIIYYSISEIDKSLNEGKAIYEFVENSVSIFPVGVVPIYPLEGYLFIKDGKELDTKVYEYQISIFQNSTETYRGISTDFIGSYQHSIINTFEAIKIDLIRTIPKLPRPAVYVAETSLAFPMEETLLPIVKRQLVRHIATTT